MKYEEGKEFEELPHCFNCGKQVSPTLYVLETPKGEQFPCCSRKCIDKYHEGVTGKKPNWVRPKGFVEERNGVTEDD